ncbi:MAG: hypothetical protein SO155_05815, partial [Candidatus Ventricola sp.]|nr:hypothetical protein [Candidatus Ventricola sp.]
SNRLEWKTCEKAPGTHLLRPNDVFGCLFLTAPLPGGSNILFTLGLNDADRDGRISDSPIGRSDQTRLNRRLLRSLL